MTLKIKLVSLLTAAGITFLPGACNDTGAQNKPILEQITAEQITVKSIPSKQKIDTLGEKVKNYLSNNKVSQLKKKIVIDKSERKLSVYLNETLLKEYGVSLGAEPKGDKERRGDMRTPEGEFYVAKKLPNSKFYKGLLISYPNKEDAERGLKSKLIEKKQYQKIKKSIDKCEIPHQGTKLGGAITIHGGGGGPSYRDWTWGCIALNNNDMDEVYDFANTGCETKILIKP